MTLLRLLLLYGLISFALAQGASAYSVQDDIQSMNAYKAKPGHKEMASIVYSQAVEQLRKQNYLKARPLLEEAIRLDPGCADFYSSYGYCQTWLTNNKEGAEALARALALGQPKSIYFYRKAICYFSTMQFKEAITELNKLLAKDPTNALALRLRGRCYRTLHEDNSSVADFSELIKLNAYTAEAYTERGNIYANSNQSDKALQDFNAAIKANSAYGEAYVGRANIYYSRHNFQAAADNYTAANVYGNDKTGFCNLQRKLCIDAQKGAR